jgi:parallel beta-helix repeat protein
MKKIRAFEVIAFLFLLYSSVVLSSVTSNELVPSILFVGGTGSGNYSSIQSAINNSIPGDVVFVYTGIYHENLIIEKSLHLLGQNKNTTIINGDANTFVVTLLANNITLSDLTITNSEKKFPYAGIYVHSNDNTISDTILTDNYYGMQLGYSAQGNRILNNTIFHNQQCGIYFNHASENILMGNTVYDHNVNGFGLYEFSNNNSIIGNVFSQNGNTGVNIRESYQNQVRNNMFLNNTLGLHKPSPEYQTSTENNGFSENTQSLDEERDAFVFTVVVFDILVFFVFLLLRKISC